MYVYHECHFTDEETEAVREVSCIKIARLALTFMLHLVTCFILQALGLSHSYLLSCFLQTLRTEVTREYGRPMSVFLSLCSLFG